MFQIRINGKLKYLIFLFLCCVYICKFMLSRTNYYLGSASTILNNKLIIFRKVSILVFKILDNFNCLILTSHIIP